MPLSLSATTRGVADVSVCSSNSARGPHLPSSSKTHIQPVLKEEVIGPAGDHLLRKLESLYWNSLKRELEHIIATMREWQSAKYDAVAIDDEDDDFVYGFDKFIEQVDKDSRHYADDYMRTKKQHAEQKKNGVSPSYDQALKERERALRQNMSSLILKKEVRAGLPQHYSRSKLEHRARMLLQCAGWLDLDKLVEHRPPLPAILKFWKRPTAPQLRLERFDRCSLPIYRPLQCAICRAVVRGSMFQCVIDDCHERRGRREHGHVCQDCYDDGREHDPSHLIKSLKHCVLPTTISPDISQAICHCGSIPRIDQDGQSRRLFPIAYAEQTKHRSSKGLVPVRCGLLDLKDIVAEAKYASMQSKIEKRITLADEGREAIKKRDKQRARVDKEMEKQLEKQNRPHGKLKKAFYAANVKMLEEGIRTGQEEAAQDVPTFMKQQVEQYPFGNVHVALRLGPLIIENGVP